MRRTTTAANVSGSDALTPKRSVRSTRLAAGPSAGQRPFAPLPILGTGKIAERTGEGQAGGRWRVASLFGKGRQASLAGPSHSTSNQQPATINHYRSSG